jgi:3-oxoacyl-ACP reductase-like protein
MRFQDKIAIVTGGASGIGKEVATRFVAEGGSVEPSTSSVSYQSGVPQRMEYGTFSLIIRAESFYVLAISGGCFS